MAGETRWWLTLVALCVKRVESVPQRLRYVMIVLLEVCLGGEGDRLRVKPDLFWGL